ncbi:acetate--CoA ligase family protein [Variovorax humicola]|uniref:Acetate--CoA ligase family protein n=1 Tax=Variovorax humicola TaxID=1769758 RepID=A0ABU8W369_9BURK
MVSMQVDRLLAPKSIVVVGASARPESPGARVFAGLKRLGYEGAIYLVNPSRKELDGHPCVASIAEVPQGVDLAVLCVPKTAVQASLEECIARQVGAAVVFAAGYAEQDAEGTQEQEKLARTARDAGVALLGPNCLGFANLQARVPITMVNVAKPASDAPGIAIIAQSGAFMSSLYASMALKGIPVSSIVSVGNQAVLGVEDFMERFIDDEAISVITVFAERLGEPQRFLEIAARARARKKPIVLMHTGRSSKARDAAQSHTGALAGDDAIMRALVALEAVILADSIDELADVSALAAMFREAPTKGVGVVTNSGALRGITFDFCESMGLDVPALEPATIAKMAARLPAFAVAENPIDVTVQAIAEPDLIGTGARALLDDPNIGSAVLAVHAGKEAAEYARLAGPMLKNSRKPVAYALLGEGAPLSAELSQALRENGIPMFRSVERALGAVARLTAYGNACLRAARVADRAAKVPALAGSGTLTEYESKRWMKQLGVPVPKGELATNVEDARRIAAEIGYPVVLKAQASALAHKSDAGGVILNVGHDAALLHAWDELHANIRRAKGDLTLDGVLVETMARKGTELVIGVKRDPDWGPVMLIGLGGIWIEILKDVRLMPLDLSEDAIVEELGKLRANGVLKGARGALPADVRAVARIAAALGKAVLATPQIAEIDLNPVIVYPEGEGTIALDALIVTTTS